MTPNVSLQSTSSTGVMQEKTTWVHPPPQRVWVKICSLRIAGILIQRQLPPFTRIPDNLSQLDN